MMHQKDMKRIGKLKRCVSINIRAGPIARDRMDETPLTLIGIPLAIPNSEKLKWYSV